MNLDFNEHVLISGESVTDTGTVLYYLVQEIDEMISNILLRQVILDRQISNISEIQQG